MVAGPSEIVVVADGKNDSDWIAADLLSQSEHDPTSHSILFTDDAAFAKAVAEDVDLQIGALATPTIARAALDATGAIIVTATPAQAVPLLTRPPSPPPQPPLRSTQP